MTIASRIFGRLWKLPPPLNRVEVKHAVPVRMRDGISLLTDVFLPSGSSRAPAILLRSPYGRGTLINVLAHVFAERGYVVILQSVRGTFGSEGNFKPFFQEREDGLDTVDWIERQDWYDGKLGLYGASYLGQVQWAIAAELGDRVAAINLDRTTADFAAAIRESGGFRLEDFLSWSSMLAIQERSNVFILALKRAIFGDPLAKNYAQVPLRTMDETVIGEHLSFWRDWVDHEDPADDFWEPIRDRRKMANVMAPINLTAGWADLFIGQQFRDYLALRDVGTNVRLTIDKGTHSGFPEQAARLGEAFAWFEMHLKDGSAQIESPYRTRVWMNGEDSWRDLVQWPELSDGLALYPSADGCLSDHVVPGELSFCWSPSDPTPSKEGPTLATKTGRGDMRSLASRKDVLDFTTAPLPKPVEIVGEAIVELEVCADAPTYDLFVCLCDVRPDGRSTNVTDGYVRLSPGTTGDRRSVTVRLLPTAWRLDVSHSLQLLVAGGAFPRYARNLGTGEPAGTATAMRDVTITLKLGAASLLRLPVLPNPD